MMAVQFLHQKVDIENIQELPKSSKLPKPSKLKNTQKSLKHQKSQNLNIKINKKHQNHQKLTKSY